MSVLEKKRKWWHRYWWLNPFWVWLRNKELEEECVNWANVLAGTVEMTELIMRGSKTEISLKSEKLIKLYGFACRNLLTTNNAENYVEMSFTELETNQRYVITVQRVDKKTPHEFRREIEAKVATLFDKIKHGDEKHQEWLKSAIEEHFKKEGSL